MNFQQKLRKEIIEVLVTTLYFVLWFGVLMSLKTLYLSEYHIEVRGFSLALVGALIVAKVVLLMEHVTLGQWIRNHAVALEILLRTVLCTIGVALALLLERGFEARHEHGGFWNSVVWVFQHRDGRHVWADSIGVGAALLAYNTLRAIRRHLGEGRLHRVFLSPPASEPSAHAPSDLTRTP
jgi:hypothetical protein